MAQSTTRFKTTVHLKQTCKIQKEIIQPTLSFGWPKKIKKQFAFPSPTNNSVSMFEKKFFNNSSKLLNGFNSL